MNLICNKCEKTADESEFVRSNGKARNTCKECQRAYAKEHYRKNKQAYLDRNRRKQSGGSSKKKCPDCGCQMDRRSLTCLDCRKKRLASKTDIRYKKWKNGDNQVLPAFFRKTGNSFPEWLRVRLYRERGNCCESCGWSKIPKGLGYPLLEIDHADGNYKNNSYVNMVVLCRNCHGIKTYESEKTSGRFSNGDHPLNRLSD